MDDRSLLDKRLEEMKKEYPSVDKDRFFDFFCAERILLNYGLDHDEIVNGIVDGPHDGGIDAAYLFVNGRLVPREEGDLDFYIESLGMLSEPVVEFYIVQSTKNKGFEESVLDKLLMTTLGLFNVTDASSSFIAKDDIVDIFKSYRKVVKEFRTSRPKVSIRMFYCCRGGTSISNAIVEKSEILKQQVEESIHHETEVLLYGEEKLYELSKKVRDVTKELPFVHILEASEKSYVVLCELRDYKKFISDEEGAIMTRIFDANVRDYQGGIEINNEIVKTLQNPIQGVDFWWLNNGITIVSNGVSYIDDHLVIENPLIVNGLQTSYSIHQNLSDSEDRKIMIRVIHEEDQDKRNSIIKATNKQTTVGHSSFYAMDPIHQRIEDYLKSEDIYYDRRRGHYKMAGKNFKNIVSIDKMAQSVLSILTEEPHAARGRPTTILKTSERYEQIFPDDASGRGSLNLYKVAITMLLKIEEYFKSSVSQDKRKYKNNLRFHVLMVLSWELNQGKGLTRSRIEKIDTRDITPELLENVTSWVFEQFDKSEGGPEDRTAKNSPFTDQLKGNWKPGVLD